VSDYARALPHLGFDPTPGDVGLTRGLARQYSQVAQELQQVLGTVRGVDTSGWQGRAGDALRTLLGTFPPALQQTITTVQDLQSAASSWAGQLAGFQSEADALERQAATAAAAPPARPAAAHPPQPAAGSAPAPTLSAIQSRAHELNARYLAAAKKTAEGVPEDPGVWEKTEPIRKVLEFVLAPLDIVAADHWIGWLEKAAGVPSDWLKELDTQIEAVQSLRGAGQPATDALVEAASYAERVGRNWDAWEAWAPGWLKTAAGSISEIRGLSYTLGGLGILADAGTIISPQDSGVMGWVDRGAAGVNGALLAVNMATDEIPVVGEVTLIGTGVYLAGDFLYHHWTPFRNVANDVGHGTVKAAEWAGHEASSAWHSVTSTIGSWF
jgi:hypothetical protein